MTIIDLDDLSQKIHATAVEKGFWSDKCGEDQANQILAKMMLIDSEVSELAEAYVKEHGAAAIESEIIDILIRTLDLHAALKQYDIISGSVDAKLIEKMDKNNSRPKLHDKLM